MATLIAQSVSIDLIASKPSGLSDLGLPAGEQTQIKKGQRQEFLQPVESGGIARRYQNIRVLVVKAMELDRLFTKLIVRFEVFADDWTSSGDNTGVDYVLMHGDRVLHTLPDRPLFLPYCRYWYENQYERTIPNDMFEAISQLQFVANADDMQAA